MKLYSEEFVHGWCKCKFVASFCDVPLECPKFEAGKDDEKKEEMKKVSPLGVYPYLECNEGVIFSSNSICRYIASLHVDKYIYGETNGEKCKIDGYLDMTTLLLEIPLQAYENRIKQDNKKIDQTIENAILKDIDTFLSNLDIYLYKNTYLACNRLSLADISIASTIYFYLQFSSLSSSPSSIFHQKYTLSSFLAKYNNVNRWFITITNHPKWIKTYKDISSSYSKKMGIEIKNTPKKEKAPAPTTTESATGEEEEKPKKKENELDLLPPSSLDLNEWKREYSNNKDLYGEVMKWFWEHYDDEGYSIYLMKYDKMEGECTVGFITANQVGGFLQRLDPNFRKYSFGVIDVLGKEGDYNISGVWLFRGKDIPFMMKDHVSYEYHTFTKLDPKKAEDKQLITDYWCACDNLQGTPISDSKVWK